MNNSISKDAFSKHLEELVQDFVKEKLELIMREEMKNYFEVENPSLKSSKNGFYHRVLDTRYGRIDDLAVPRDREGYFTTHLFDPYQRREKWLGETIINMYQHGFSTRDVGTFMERIIGKEYSAGTISNITNVVMEDIEEWKNRTLSKRYSVLYLDGTYFKLRREDVDDEVIYLIIGITEEGYKEILSFQVGGQESSHAWKDQLFQLHERGVEQVLLGVFDGLPGLDIAFKEAFPKADVQRCVVHKVRNLKPAIRKKDQLELFNDLRKVYHATDRPRALEHFEEFKDKWQKTYPKVVKSWEEETNDLLRFYDYPKIIQRQIYTTNKIERVIKEYKKRLRPMNSLPSEKAVEKIVYLITLELNEKSTKRTIREFSSARDTLNKMFEKRYGLGE